MRNAPGQIQADVVCIANPVAIFMNAKGSAFQRPKVAINRSFTAVVA
jgi:hypothetical protein